MATIVFCEDDASIQKLIRVALRSTPHRIFIEADGRLGLECAVRECADIVFTDLSMPNMDGFQLCDAIKSQPDLAHIPVILLTASAQRVQIEEFTRHDFAGYLLKPFSMSDLRLKVEEITASLAAH